MSDLIDEIKEDLNTSSITGKNRRWTIPLGKPIIKIAKWLFRRIDKWLHGSKSFY